MDTANQRHSWKEDLSATTDPLSFIACSSMPRALSAGVFKPGPVQSLSCRLLTARRVLLLQNWGKELERWIGAQRVRAYLVTDTGQKAVQVR